MTRFFAAMSNYQRGTNNDRLVGGFNPSKNNARHWGSWGHDPDEVHSDESSWSTEICRSTRDEYPGRWHPWNCRVREQSVKMFMCACHVQKDPCFSKTKKCIEMQVVWIGNGFFKRKKKQK